MKNKNFLLIIFILISFTLSGCAETGPIEEATDSYDLSNDFFLYKTDANRFDLVKNPDDEDPKLILENVSKISSNDDFILAEQIEIIQLGKEKKEVYWIINPNNKKIYGPMEYSEFESQRQELKVDENLELKNSDQYLK
ncbi:DUF3997 domain-containing protein [Senegalia sp. (in: firmicutes)]|uniref:DUF3997 domain-containing protein n=2 Tax=Senegalia sp. (in: firmicutes) TaxID=1924098 RepID=UPI003F9D37C0